MYKMKGHFIVLGGYGKKLKFLDPNAYFNTEDFKD